MRSFHARHSVRFGGSRQGNSKHLLAFHVSLLPCVCNIDGRGAMHNESREPGRQLKAQSQAAATSSSPAVQRCQAVLLDESSKRAG